MDLPRRLRLFLLPLALLVAGARPAAAEGPRLLAPAGGVELTAGSLAALEWEAPPPGAEEWEAFLSLDGGKTYPLRITPHLDLSIRRFSFRVPAFPTREARLLLRFGDERREVEIETPQRFAIAPGWDGDSPARLLSLSEGEKARPEDDGVVFWVEGSRDGTGLREVEAAPLLPALRSVERGRLPLLPLLWPAPGRAELPWLAASASLFPITVEPPGDAAAPAPRTAQPVRLLIHRFNE